MSMKDNIITIDGPSASGKGSLARNIAAHLNFDILDSGLLYRVYAYLYDCGLEHSKIVSHIKKDIFFKTDLNGLTIQDGKEDITGNLRSEKTAKAASKISSLKETRSNLLELQRDFYSSKGLVADGRDMGTVVFPNAGTKIFLIADPEVRAKRRFLELQNAGQGVNMRDLIDDIRLRDEADKAREISPLMPADDSIEVNSSDLTPQEVLEIVLKIYKENTKEV